ncbi:hypothetical protein FB451DRAFT_1453522 [Mycena latifolia]|nr:hypothetical protein FB451DRAFT_1453522 [Mycena latifolia]
MATHHIAAMLIPAWGHTVSYIYLATRMLQKDSTLALTMVQHNSVVPQMEKELNTLTLQFSPATVKEAIGQTISGWMETIPQLAEGSESWPKPHTIHMDFFSGGFVIEPTKEMMGPECKMLLWFSCALASMPAFLTDYDFAKIAQEIYSDETRRQGRSMDDIVDEVGLAWNGTDKLCGRVIGCPGTPDMYDYERVAYAAGMPDGIAQVLVRAQKFAKLADGYIVPTTACIEPVGMSHCRELIQKREQELFTVGPQAHELCWTDTASPAPTNEVVRSFLDDARAKYGAGSVLYISFGSLFFPTTTPQLVEALVEALLALQKPFPFIFALGGKLASLPKELIERVNSSSKGLICAFWVEQRAILQHNGVGWFLTHGGWNSISESLSQGVPLIVWPTTGEQPINAALLSSGTYPVAIELMQARSSTLAREVRAGPGLAPPLRGGPAPTGTIEDATAEFNGVFGAARGPRGAVVAANARDMARALRAARAGEVGEEICRLAQF